jgi:hypothetical protein
LKESLIFLIDQDQGGSRPHDPEVDHLIELLDRVDAGLERKNRLITCLAIILIVQVTALAALAVVLAVAA